VGERKSLGRVEIKDADKGTFAALIAQFNVVDTDGDVTNSGAFPEGKAVPVSSYGHTSWEGQLPVGTATLRQTRTEAIAEGRFYLDTSGGKDTWATLKAMQSDGHPSEWSYGYDATEYSFGEFEGQRVRFLKAVDVFEVSPVLRGAGIGTRTLSVKSGNGSGKPEGENALRYKGSIAPHRSMIVDQRWDAVKAARNLGLGATIEQLRACHAWYDPTGDPEYKSSYHFLHHERPGGAANLRACYLGISALNGAKGMLVPADARQDVYDHLASHIRDADREAPALSGAGEQLKLRERAMVLLADLTDLNGEFAEVGASRLLKGERMFTGAQREILGWIREELSALSGHLDSPEAAAQTEYLRFLRTQLSIED
jgi:hypothetical protein